MDAPDRDRRRMDWDVDMSLSLVPNSIVADRGTWKGVGTGAAAGAVAGGLVGAGAGAFLREGIGPVGMGAGLAAAGGAISGAATGAFGVGGGIAASILTPLATGAFVLKKFGASDIGIMMAAFATIPVALGGVAGALGGLAVTDR